MDTIRYDGHAYLAINKCVNFEEELCFEQGKCMWRKHRSVYQDYMKYVRNDIVKSFNFKILRYAQHVQEMHELDKYLPPPPMKGESAMANSWALRNEEFTTGDIRLSIRDGLPKSMRDELDDHPEDYRSLTYEDWCDLLSTIEVKHEKKGSRSYQEDSLCQGSFSI